MRTLTDALHNHGGTTEYTTKDGKVLKVRFLDLRGMSEYECRLQNRAMKKLTEQKEHISKETFNEMFSQLLDKIATGHYAFGSELCAKSLPTVQGITDLVSIMCNVTTDDALDLLITEGDAFKMLIDNVLRKSIGSKDDEVKDSQGNE